MKLNLMHCSENTQKLAEELKKQIPLEMGEDGLKLITEERTDGGFAINKKKEEIKISYGSLPDLCRAILAVCSRKEEAYYCKEKPFCKDFGVMLDCSRNAVIRMEQLKKYIRILAMMGYRYIGLYMEDTIAVEEEPYFGYMRGAFTSRELKEADAYAAVFGMEIRAYIQTLAHLNQITRYGKYRDVIDCNDILLAEEEKTYDFLEHIIKSVSENLTSRKVNIGMDEANMVGLGKYLDKHGFINRFDIMEKHLNRVLSITRKYGLETEIWSDMLFSHVNGMAYSVKDQEVQDIPDIPEDVGIVYWDYFSTDTDHYDEMFQKHKKLTSKVGFAAGAWKWIGFAPNNRYSICSGKAAIDACRKNNILSVVITAWGDDGAEACPFSILPALYADAEYIYKDVPFDQMEDRKFEVLTGIDFNSFLEIDNVNIKADKEGNPNNSCKYLFYNDPLIGTFDSVLTDGIGNYYRETGEKLAKLAGDSNLGYMFETLSALCRVLSQKADLGVQIRKAYLNEDRETLKKIEDTVIPSVINKLDQFYQAFEKQWRTDNKTFGFEVQCIRIGGLKQRLIYTKNILHRYLGKEVMRIDEQEEKQLAYAYSDISDIKHLNYNQWVNIVSPSVLG